MAKKSKLLAALDAHKGRDYDAEKRKKQIKAAEKKKRGKAAGKSEEDKENDDTEMKTGEESAAQEDFEDFSEGNDDEGVQLNGVTSLEALNGAEDSDDDDEEEAASDSDDSAISLSSLSPSDLEDTIPHQRLTINNTSALLSARSRIALLRKHPSPSTAPFHLHNSHISTLPPASTAIPDPMDDLSREAQFYAIARTAALSARSLLKKEGVPFTRPADYFAEMVKTETHMERITSKTRREASERQGREDARQQRDAKKFGKQVQRLKEEERARSKRDTLDKIKDLKRKRKDGGLGEETREAVDDDGMFEKIDVEKAGVKDRQGRERGGGVGGPMKRQKKDAKFGFGGKKRFSKSGDAESSGDLSGFSAKRMKGRGGGASGRGGGAAGGRGGRKRLGKSKRDARR